MATSDDQQREITELAQKAYAAYANVVFVTSYLAFDQLPERVQQGWYAAASTMILELAKQGRERGGQAGG